MRKRRLKVVLLLSLLLEAPIIGCWLTVICITANDKGLACIAQRAIARITSCPTADKSIPDEAQQSKRDNVRRRVAEKLSDEGARLRAEGTATSARTAIIKYEQSLPNWEAVKD